MEKDKPDAQLNRKRKKGEKANSQSLRDTGLSLWFDPHNKPWLKIIACIVIGAFLHQDIVWAAGTTYTDDLKLMFEHPARRVIERLGALFSIKDAYAFEPYYDSVGVGTGGPIGDYTYYDKSANYGTSAQGGAALAAKASQNSQMYLHPSGLYGQVSYNSQNPQTPSFINNGA